MLFAEGPGTLDIRSDTDAVEVATADVRRPLPLPVKNLRPFCSR